MKTRTLIQLLTLGSNLYIMSQDKELMEKLSAMAADGKQKLDDWLAPGEGEDDEAGLLERLKERAKQVEEKMEERLEELAVKVYQKLHIAHVQDLQSLQQEIASLREEVARLKSERPQ